MEELYILSDNYSELTNIFFLTMYEQVASFLNEYALFKTMYFISYKIR